MANVLLGKPVADKLDEQSIADVQKLAVLGITPQLDVVRIGNREDDQSYERSIIKRAEKLGVRVSSHVFSDVDPAQSINEIHGYVAALADSKATGVLVFRPYPKAFAELDEVFEQIPAALDVDGMTKASQALLYSATKPFHAPATAVAVIQILKHYEYILAGTKVVVLGRSQVIGLPVAHLLLQENATVTICHSKTQNLEREIADADVIVLATGRAGILSSKQLHAHQTLIDVGINWDEKNQKIVGDFKLEGEPTLLAYTPVPRGVGSVTTSIILQHTIEGARRRFQH